MPYYNYILEADLKSYIPEISRLVWDDESDFSNQKREAENTVLQDIQSKGYRGIDVMPHLNLRSSGNTISSSETGSASVEDYIGRMRFVVNCTLFTTGGKTITLYGRNSSNEEWLSVETLTITATGIKSVAFTRQFKFYKIDISVSAGTIDLESYLVDCSFDRLIIFKWLEIILLDRYVNENDQYFLKMLYFQDAYNKAWNKIKIYTDNDNNGSITSNEYNTTSSITMLK